MEASPPPSLSSSTRSLIREVVQASILSANARAQELTRDPQQSRVGSESEWTGTSSPSSVASSARVMIRELVLGALAAGERDARAILSNTSSSCSGYGECTSENPQSIGLNSARSWDSRKLTSMDTPTFTPRSDDVAERILPCIPASARQYIKDVVEEVLACAADLSCKDSSASSCASSQIDSVPLASSPAQSDLDDHNNQTRQEKMPSEHDALRHNQQRSATAAQSGKDPEPGQTLTQDDASKWKSEASGLDQTKEVQRNARLFSEDDRDSELAAAGDPRAGASPCDFGPCNDDQVPQQEHAPDWRIIEIAMREGDSHRGADIGGHMTDSARGCVQAIVEQTLECAADLSNGILEGRMGSRGSTGEPDNSLVGGSQAEEAQIRSGCELEPPLSSQSPGQESNSDVDRPATESGSGEQRTGKEGGATDYRNPEAATDTDRAAHSSQSQSPSKAQGMANPKPEPVPATENEMEFQAEIGDTKSAIDGSGVPVPAPTSICADDGVQSGPASSDSFATWEGELDRLRIELATPPMRDSMSTSARGLIADIVGESLCYAEDLVGSLQTSSRPPTRNCDSASGGATRPDSRGMTGSARSFVHRVVREALDVAEEGAGPKFGLPVADDGCDGSSTSSGGLTDSAKRMIWDVVSETMLVAGVEGADGDGVRPERRSPPRNLLSSTRDGEAALTDSARGLIHEVVFETVHGARMASEGLEGRPGSHLGVRAATGECEESLDLSGSAQEQNTEHVFDLEVLEPMDAASPDSWKGGAADQPSFLDYFHPPGGDSDESEDNVWVYRMAHHFCTKSDLLPTVSPIRLQDFEQTTAALDPIAFHLRHWPDADEHEEDDDLDPAELDFGSYEGGSDGDKEYYDRFVCEGEIAVGEEPMVFEFEVDPVAQGITVLVEGCCGRVSVQRLFYLPQEEEAVETEEQAAERTAAELVLKQEYRKASRRAKIMTTKREQGFREAQDEVDALYNRIVNCAKKHPPIAHFHLPYQRQALEMSITAAEVKRREGKLPWGPTVTDPIELQGTGFGGLWSLTFTPGGHGLQPISFRAAALSTPADDDERDKQATRTESAPNNEGKQRVLGGHKWTSQELETMRWTKENKVAMSRYHSSAFDGMKTGPEHEAAVRAIQRAWVDNAAQRRARASELMRFRMYQSLEEVDKKLLGNFLLKDNYDEIDDYRKAERLARALRHGVPFEPARLWGKEHAILKLSVSAFMKVCARRKADAPPTQGSARLEDVLGQLQDMRTRVARTTLEDAIRETSTANKPQTPQSRGSASGGSSQSRKRAARTVTLNDLTRAAQKIIHDVSEAPTRPTTGQTTDSSGRICVKSGPDAISELSTQQLENRLEAMRLRLQFRSEQS